MRFVHDFKGFARIEEVEQINRAMVEMTNNFNLGVDKDDIEAFLEVIPEKSTNEELLELEPEHIAEDEARERKLLQEKKITPKKIDNEGFSTSFCKLQQSP